MIISLGPAGSHTPIDLISGNGRIVFAVQVKQGGHISKEEKLELIEWARTFIAIPMVSVKEGNRWILKFIGDSVND